MGCDAFTEAACSPSFMFNTDSSLCSVQSEASHKERDQHIRKHKLGKESSETPCTYGQDVARHEETSPL